MSPMYRRPRSAKIITFYSYKGGTGRTMLLANVAWILASNGHRVLTVDWDLEAPGLHRYFAPFLIDKKLEASDGIIDMISHFAVQAMTPQPEGKPREKDWYKPLADIQDYVLTLQWKFPGSGRLDLVPAGSQGPAYSTRVNAFNWQNFYERLGGGAFLEAVKQSMRESYDYVLIDSRTGVSDTAGVCTVHLPDDLVVCFTLNHQSILGASAVAESVAAQRQQPGFRILPVPTRIEDAEKHKLEYGRDDSRERFGRLVEKWLPTREQQKEYWGSVELPYKPYYAYEEILATFGDRPGQTNSLLAAVERLTRYLTDGKVTRLGELPDSERKQVLAEFERSPADRKTADVEHDVFISYSRHDAKQAHILAEELVHQGLNVFLASSNSQVSLAGLEQVLVHSRHFVTLFSGEMGAWQHAELNAMLRISMVSRVERRLVPVLIRKLPSEAIPPFLRQLQVIRAYDYSNTQQLAAAIKQALSGSGPSASAPDDPHKGKWGGRAEANERRLSATVSPHPESPDLFHVRLEVQATSPDKPLRGTVCFHLHPTFKHAMREVPVRKGVATLKLIGWGAFTVGVEADDGATRLELDLSTVEGAPAEFRDS